MITRLLKSGQEEQKASLRKFIKLSIDEKIEVFEIQRDTFYKIKQVNKDVSIHVLSYVAHIKAINKYHSDVKNIDRFAAKIRERTFKKQPKKDKLLGCWALVKTLKNDKNLSFRQISKYLKKYHKFEVVHSTIYDLWKELENKKKGENKNDG